MVKSSKSGKEYAFRAINCPVCFQAVSGRFSPQRIYCSLKCSHVGIAKKRRNGLDTHCLICGLDVHIPSHRVKEGRKYFCGQDHANEYQARNKIIYKCKICQKSFKKSKSFSLLGEVKYCSIKCRNEDPDFKTRLVQQNLKLQEGNSTRLEIKGYQLIEETGVYYKKQVLICNKFCVDAFIPSHNLVIQFDGDYWHGKPSTYSKLDARQKKRVDLDKSQDAYMRKCGYKIFRIWESDINKPSVKDSLLELLSAPLIFPIGQ